MLSHWLSHPMARLCVQPELRTYSSLQSKLDRRGYFFFNKDVEQAVPLPLRNDLVSILVQMVKFEIYSKDKLETR